MTKLLKTKFLIVFLMFKSKTWLETSLFCSYKERKSEKQNPESL